MNFLSYIKELRENDPALYDFYMSAIISILIFDSDRKPLYTKYNFNFNPEE